MRRVPGVTTAPHRARALRRSELWRGSIGVFAIHSVALTDGPEIELAMIEHRGASAVAPLLDPEWVVLLRQYRYAAGGEIWEVPAGKLDPDESPEHCAERELREETGFSAGRIVETGRILTAPGFTDELIHLFCAFDLEPGEARPEASERIETHEIRLQDALAMIVDGEIIDAKTIVALHHAARLVGSPPTGT